MSPRHAQACPPAQEEGSRCAFRANSSGPGGDSLHGPIRPCLRPPDRRLLQAGITSTTALHPISRRVSDPHTGLTDFAFDGDAGDDDRLQSARRARPPERPPDRSTAAAAATRGQAAPRLLGSPCGPIRPSTPRDSRGVSKKDPTLTRSATSRRDNVTTLPGCR